MGFREVIVKASATEAITEIFLYLPAVVDENTYGDNTDNGERLKKLHFSPNFANIVA